jgi:hypothetical protein
VIEHASYYKLRRATEIGRYPEAVAFMTDLASYRGQKALADWLDTCLKQDGSERPTANSLLLDYPAAGFGTSEEFETWMKGLPSSSP